MRMQFSQPIKRSVLLTTAMIWGVLGPMPVLAQGMATGANPSLNPPSPDPVPSANTMATGSAAPVFTTPTANYRLGPGDRVEITVFEYPEVTGPKIISPDGSITMPIIGSIAAANRTPSQFAEELRLRLREYLKNPVVTVGVTQFRPLLINIAGEVQRPGPIQLRNVESDPNGASDRNNPTTLPTISAALLAAGGVTRDADIRQVMLRRGDRTYVINLWDALQSEKAPPDSFLQDGDALFIPKLDPAIALDRRLVAKSTLAPRTIRVRVVGEVKKPGEVEVPPNSSISGAVAIAGGPTDKARLKRVTLVRLGDDGKIAKQTLDLSNLIDSQQVLDGDVVMVPKDGRSSVLDIAGQAIPPLGILLNLFRN
jgi:polysaccharide biosynthesis/export protein